MWKLTIEDDEGKPTSLPLVHDEYSLGRGETNAIRLTDRNVSRKHATLKKNGAGWVLADLQSYNGTFVNNERVVGERAVASGDVRMVGDYRLILTDETAAAAAGVPATGPVLPVQYRPNRLVIVVGPNPGTEFPLDKDNFTIGRSEDATISINHSSVSRIHAELIALGGGRFEIIDKGSANGIRVNGVELKRGILEAGDALELGDVRLRFVGAGKVFRSTADQTQTVPAVSAGAAGQSSALGGLGTGKIVGILLGALAVIVLVVWALLGSGKPSTGSGHGSGRAVVTPGSADDNGPALLDEAKKLFDGGDIESAHRKVQEIPEGSAAFEGTGVKTIENAWADWIFKKAEEAKTNDEKRALLKQVPPNTYVDKERREKAITLMGTLPPEPTPGPVGGPVGGPGPGPGTGPGTAPAPTATAEPTTTKTSAPAGTSTGAPAGAIDEAAIRKGLEGKVWSGKASIEEIRMLKAICSHMGDRACRDRANQMLKQKQEQMQK
jgi:ABC transport system ATP-binding/permease protein